MSFDESATRADMRQTMHKSETRSITGVLAHLRHAVQARPETDKITLRHLLVALEQNSFIVILLIFALLLVSPLSAIPGATTIFGLTIACILAQQLLGRQHAWLPGLLLNRSLSVQRTMKALQWLEKPAGWLERCLHPRLFWVIEPPVAIMLKAMVFTAALCAPLMEVIPASGTSVGAAITVFSAGLLARDGVFVLLGACLAAILPVTLWVVIR